MGARVRPGGNNHAPALGDTDPTGRRDLGSSQAGPTPRPGSITLGHRVMDLANRMCGAPGQAARPPQTLPPRAARLPARPAAQPPASALVPSAHATATSAADQASQPGRANLGRRMINFAGRLYGAPAHASSAPKTQPPGTPPTPARPAAAQPRQPPQVAPRATPRVTLRDLLDAETAEWAAERRGNAIGKLERMKDHFVALKQANCSTTQELDSPMDRACLKAIALAENARKPGLNLKTFDSFDEFAAALKSGDQQPFRAVVPMPMSPHRVAVDVKFQQGAASVIAVEALGVEGMTEHFDLMQHGMLHALPASARLTVLTSNAQQSLAGCVIFASSAALKLHENAAAIDAMHSRQMSGQPIGASALAEDQDAGAGRIGLVDGKPLLPLGFVKHAQSKTKLEEWLDVRGVQDAQASTKQLGGPTLLQRHHARRVERFDDAAARTRTFGASIEDKRIVLLNRAIEHLRSAPDDEVQDVLDGMARHVPDFDQALAKATPGVAGQVNRTA